MAPEIQLQKVDNVEYLYRNNASITCDINLTEVVDVLF